MATPLLGAEKKKAAPAKPTREPGLYAVFKTSLGTIVCKLFEKEAPKTVANFTGLAAGTKDWTDPQTGLQMKKPLYNGTIFHRVIPNFMIQGGDPLGNGTGGPGYRFEDEYTQGLPFDRAGRLAMANAGPHTNGSQFFITHKETPHLNYRQHPQDPPGTLRGHTVFGQVVEGQDVVVKIGGVETVAQNRPAKDVVLESVSIERIAAPKPQKKQAAKAKK